MVCVWSSVNSVCSVGPPTPPVNLCKSVQSVGGLFSTLLQNVLAKYVLPQNSRNSQNRLAEIFSHRFHRFSQMVRVWNSVNSVCSVGLPTPPVDLCKSVQSVGGLFWLRGVIALLVHFCLVGAFCFVGALETSAPPMCTPYRATKEEGFTPRSR